MKMNLEELLRNKEIYRMKHGKELAPKAIKIAKRDLKTAKDLFKHGIKFLQFIFLKKNLFPCKKTEKHFLKKC